MACFTAIYENIQVTLPFELARLTHLHIEEKLNAHAVLRLEGYLEGATQEEHIKDVMLEDQVEVQQLGQDTKTNLFIGVPTQVTVDHDGDFWKVSMVAMSYSILLDFQKHRRSFQDLTQTYQDMLQQVVKAYPEGMLVFEVAEQMKGSSIIQYDETDWEWLLRISSYLGVPIYPYVERSGPKIYVGLHTRETYDAERKDYRLEKALRDYMAFKAYEEDASEADFERYTIKGELSYPLGQQISFQGRAYPIVKKVVELKFGQIIYTYTIQNHRGTRRHPLYNQHIKGVGIEGKVLAVEKDTIKVHLVIDQKQSLEQAFWYPFAQSYTTEGQTGWYAMPEVGETVTLYSPSADERQGYIGAAVRTDGKTNTKAQDPSHNYFGTKEGNEMMLAPQTIHFQNANGNIKIKMDDTEGISVTSNKDIHVYTTEDFRLEAETFTCKAKKKLIFATAKTSIIIDQVMHITG